MKRFLVALLLLAPASFAQLVTSTPAGIVVAHDGRIELEGKWSADGVDHPTAATASSDRIAVLDSLANEMVIADLTSGHVTRHATPETPIAAEFVQGGVYVLARDARVLQHIGGPAIPVAADSAFLRRSGERLFTYSRTMGVVEEVDGDRVTRRMNVPAFASDFEVSGETGYLVYPRDGRIRTIDLPSMKAGGEIAVGAVPVDMQFAGGGSALTARILAVADPSSKRIWLAEADQSMTKAIARGFLRGLLGLGLFDSRSSRFPTGVDRVEIVGKRWFAYDTSSGTLYRFDKRKSSVVTKGVAPAAFAVSTSGVSWWSDGRLHHAP